MFGFLFWLFFIGIVVAGLQDLSRREVDDWLNLFLLISGFIFILYKSIFENDIGIIFQMGFALVLMFAIINIFYYGRVFAGGDAKLLFAMTVFFIGANFYVTLLNISIFLFLLMFSGSIYGLIFSFVLYYKDRDKVNKKISSGFESLWLKYIMIAGFFFLVLSYFDFMFFSFAILILLFPPLYVFAKALENVSMVKNVSWKELSEGDWLVENINFRGRVIKANWDGLSSDEIKFLKGKKVIKIKDGLPFVPAFFIAFLLYVFYYNWFFSFLVGLI